MKNEILEELWIVTFLNMLVVMFGLPYFTEATLAYSWGFGALLVSIILFLVVFILFGIFYDYKD